RRIGRGVRAVGLNKDRRKSARQYAISGISGVCNPRETLENFRYNFTMRIGVGSVELTGGELDMCRRRVCFVSHGGNYTPRTPGSSANCIKVVWVRVFVDSFVLARCRNDIDLQQI